MNIELIMLWIPSCISTRHLVQSPFSKLLHSDGDSFSVHVILKIKEIKEKTDVYFTDRELILDLVLLFLRH